eukprot:1183031-Pleurochrysis_carterae.AAC.1
MVEQLDQSRRALHLWRRVDGHGGLVGARRRREPAHQRLRRLHARHRRARADVARAERAAQPLGAPQRLARRRHHHRRPEPRLLVHRRAVHA